MLIDRNLTLDAGETFVPELQRRDAEDTECRH